MERKPTIKLKTLEVIAKDISQALTGTEICKLLSAAGVPQDLIHYPDTKWVTLYTAFEKLATSQKYEDKELLFNVLGELCHPATHDGSVEVANIFEKKLQTLIQYDGLTLDNGYISEIVQRDYKYDYDLELFIKKKILLDGWNELARTFIELSLNNNSVEQICYAAWDFYYLNGYEFGPNTRPENLLVEAEDNFWADVAFNWELIREMDLPPYKVGQFDGIDFEMTDRNAIEVAINEEVSEFISNKVNDSLTKSFRQTYPEGIELPDIPRFLKGNSKTFYSYKKQKDEILRWIQAYLLEYDNDLVTIHYNDFIDKPIDILRTLIALEYEGVIKIVEIGNNRKKWAEKDDQYFRIRLLNLDEVKKNTTAKKLTFDPKKAEITNGQNSLSIPLGTVEFYLCKIMFERDFGTRVTENDIVNAFDVTHNEKKRTVYDASLRLNKKIEKSFGISNFFVRENSYIWINS